MGGFLFQLNALSCPYPKTLEMENDFEEKRRKAYTGRRSIMDIGMGVVIAGFGVFFALAEKLGIKPTGDPTLRYVFAGMCLLYGFFRIYRGYKKNYYRE